MNEIEVGKIDKYKMLKDEIARMWGIKKVIIIPFVLGTLGALSNGFEKYVAAIEIDIKKEPAQKTALLGTVSILKVILGCLKNGIIVQDSMQDL